MGKPNLIFEDKQWGEFFTRAIEGALSKQTLDGVHHFWDLCESFIENFGGSHFKDELYRESCRDELYRECSNIRDPDGAF